MPSADTTFLRAWRVRARVRVRVRARVRVRIRVRDGGHLLAECRYDLLTRLAG